MAVRHSIEAQLTLHEGKRRKVYRCTAGYLSAGVGRNLDANGFSDDEIELMLRNDIAAAKRALDARMPWWRDLDPVRQKVMIDMMFNLGPRSFGGFVRTLWDIRDGRYGIAADRMLRSKWARQVGARASRLANMMRTGNDYTLE
jgi:lysozyme